MTINTNEIMKVINIIKPLIRQKVDTILTDSKGLSTLYKADYSPVTELDLYISDLFKENFFKAFPSLNFYSEEDQGQFCFPLCILDPVDGTKEFIEGRNEWVVSFGVYFSDEILCTHNFSWIYNPITGFEISSGGLICGGDPQGIESDHVMVSRTEHAKGLSKSYDGRLKLHVVGSIAYKLGLLASGKGRMVFSKRPKNVWDILAGTHICMKNDIGCYQNGELVKRITQDIYLNDLLWFSNSNQQDSFDFIYEK